MASYQSMIWIGREFLITVAMSFMILTTILWVFFETPLNEITPLYLLTLVMICTSVVFTCLGAMLFILSLLLPERVQMSDAEAESGLKRLGGGYRYGVTLVNAGSTGSVPPAKEFYVTMGARHDDILPGVCPVQSYGNGPPPDYQSDPSCCEGRGSSVVPKAFEGYSC